MGSMNSGDPFQDLALPPDYPASVAFVRRQIDKVRADDVSGVRDLEVRVGSLESTSERTEEKVDALEKDWVHASEFEGVKDTAVNAYKMTTDNAAALADLNQHAVRDNVFSDRNKEVDSRFGTVEGNVAAANRVANEAATTADQTLQEVRSTSAKLSYANSLKRGKTSLAVYRWGDACSVTLTRRVESAGGADVVKSISCSYARDDGEDMQVYAGETDGIELALTFRTERGNAVEVSAIGIRDGEVGVSDAAVVKSPGPLTEDGRFSATLSGTSSDGAAYTYALDGSMASAVAVDGEVLATTGDVKAVSDAVDAEAARAKAAEAGKADATTVTSLTTRVSNVESKKADKTAVTTLSTTVDGLKSSKRGVYDMDVYHRSIEVTITVTTVSGDSDQASTSCEFVSRGTDGTETYRGQFGLDSYLSLTFVISGGEIVMGAYGEVEVGGKTATITNLTYDGGSSNQIRGSTTLTSGSESAYYAVVGTVRPAAQGLHEYLLTTADRTEIDDSVSRVADSVTGLTATTGNLVTEINSLGGSLSDHTSDFSNPHKVTAEQVIGTNASFTEKTGVLDLTMTGLKFGGTGLTLRHETNAEGTPVRVRLDFDGKYLVFPEFSATSIDAPDSLIATGRTVSNSVDAARNNLIEQILPLKGHVEDMASNPHKVTAVQAFAANDISVSVLKSSITDPAIGLRVSELSLGPGVVGITTSGESGTPAIRIGSSQIAIPSVSTSTTMFTQYDHTAFYNNSFIPLLDRVDAIEAKVDAANAALEEVV